MDRYVVIGNPVAHSLSPLIHARFAEQTGETLQYSRLEAPEDGFAAVAASFFEGGGRGANVTLPFKVDAYRWAASHSERASRAEAANFLAMRDGRVHADNTDGVGLVTDITVNLGVPMRGKAILVLGAGGAARGVLAPLLALKPRHLMVANRTAERARELARQFGGAGRVESSSLDLIPNERFDVVINATSTSTRGEPLELPAMLFREGVLAYDMAYGDAARPFLDRAARSGARTSDGLGMLVEQAAESFYLWRGKRPQTRAVLEELRARPR
ncbi:MAG TPA: shikimate dehydrogenase [Usitatibacter sp.]|nr:shikimate dehydrogenase [Usitatibacter sp.]